MVRKQTSIFRVGLNGLLHWLFRRSPRRGGTWRRTNGRRWVLES